MPTNAPTFADVLNSYAAKYGLTTGQLARYIGEVAESVRKWRAGLAVPNEDKRAAVLQRLGIV